MRHVARSCPADDPPRPATMQLTGNLGEVAEARRWTRDVLLGVTEDELQDIELIVTELISNAYDHAVAPYALRLHRSSEPCFVRVEVDDASAELPVLGRSRFDGSRGRGMIIVNRLAKDWGVTEHATGKTVWAEITCEPPFRSA
ncbi:ATP-binding protein [Lentzea atacamensis]|nr:ATP-binding protein [Lentzea atacamensis]